MTKKGQPSAAAAAPGKSGKLTTVSVPKEFEPIFLRAQDYVRRYFSDRHEDPEQSSIIISGERYILVRAASMSVEFFELVKSLYRDKGEDEARDVANHILFDLAHALGKADAKAFRARMGVDDPIDRLSAGPIHFSFAGWAFVKIFPESLPSPDENYYLIYDHPFSFESDAWIRAGKKATFPVCIMNSGYSSGWCEESFGFSLVAAEVECMAKGDAQCRFIMAPPTRIEEHLARYMGKTRNGTAPRPASSATVSVPEFFQRKRMEEELRRSHEQLEQRVEERTKEVVSAYEQLQQETAERKRVESELRQSQKMEAIGRLAGGVAHDFNNLLTVIRGYAELLTSDRDRHEMMRDVEEIRRAADRAISLTRQLLAFSRRQVLTPEILDLNKVVDGMGRLLKPLLGEDIDLHSVLSPDLGRLRADRGQLEQVIMNLAVNARDAMPQGGVLEISTFNEQVRGTSPSGDITPGHYVVLRVRDNGVGMDADTQSHIFEPFYTTKEQGTGLGLATVYGIIKQSGGGVRMKSAVGQGTEFDILLPRLEGSVESALQAGERKTAPKPEKREETILLVEDEEAVRDLVRHVLQRNGYKMLIASSGAEALELHEKHKDRIDLLVTDVVMPQMSGRELAEWLTERRPGLKVLFMSGYTDDTAIQRGMLTPGALFLQKPFDIEDLQARIRQALGPGS